jgi:hypothetical protein
MSQKKRQEQDSKVRGFKSIAAFEAATAREGQVKALNFDGSSIRCIIHEGVAYYSVIDVCDALAETSNARRYWSDLKRQLAEGGGLR